MDHYFLPIFIYKDDIMMQRNLSMSDEFASKYHDPRALIRQIGVLISTCHYDEAKEYILYLPTAISNIKDQHIAHELKKVAGNILFEFGKIMENDKPTALSIFKLGMDFGDVHCAIEVGVIEKNTYKNYEKAVVAFKYALYLSEEISDQNQKNKIRGIAHNLIGAVFFKELDTKNTLYQLFKVLSHSRRAEAYGDEDAKYNNEKIISDLNELDLPEAQKEKLLDDSTPLLFNNGIFKPAVRLVSKPGLTEAEVTEWLKYKNPLK